MHLQRAISNFAILVVGSLTSLVAFLSNRLNQFLLVVVLMALAVIIVVAASTAKKQVGRYFPSLMGKAIVPRWNLSLRTTKPLPSSSYPRKHKDKFGVRRAAGSADGPQHADAA
ncbi:MAG: hypothetical protein WA823_14220 [Candidatus Acidiferrales bacterium]